ncbi:MAG: hypothetical protein K2Y40_06575 [Reyranella sp.]|jgi:hypothetical protein|nr:hypothetical protein [Reyranella sp.]
MIDEIKLSESEWADELAGPPLSPAADERPGAVDPAFAAECLAGLRTLPSSEQWVLGADLVTHSAQWGDVWRMDFELPGETLRPRVNRLVSWRRADGTMPIIVAIGQTLPPLHPSDVGGKKEG